MKKLLTFAFMLLAALPAFTQSAAPAVPKNEIGIFATGNLNSVSYVILSQNGAHGSGPVILQNDTEDAPGFGLSYNYWFTKDNAVGLLYSLDQSTDNLWVPAYATFPSQSLNKWALTDMHLSVVLTQQINKGKHLRRFVPFISEGVGTQVTYGGVVSGWSADFLVTLGGGTDIVLTPHWSIRNGVMLLNTKTGCFDDPTCVETWSSAEDVRSGLVYKW